MRIAVLGTGFVGRTLAARLVDVGHEVVLASRSPASDRALRWRRTVGGRGSISTYAEAAEAASLVVNATAGRASLEALDAAGADALAGKVVMDVANPVLADDVDPPVLAPILDRSLGERLQERFPRTYVVKALNTVSPLVMTRPARVPGDHVAFISGNNRQAKGVVTGLLAEFGWPVESIVDLGDISGARGMELLTPLRQRLTRSFGHSRFNLGVVRTS
ncbi:NADP oxidoreductase [Prauserella sp. PE36]|uniref:NADPH-dependent F420 reductase n=1 Tax=Prauserella sp. PE36 TaxID=1504709 RepID=UPI000D9FC251|nr:NAD(P)-binding domain-containing protein [Prauserella sp. PE36]PXY23015.1 hypothetical protein BAY59_25165 [Prauserella coralliicola]RBM17220.1 NADP oxidoreductase [Prauserella sp. PE36]